MGTSSLGLASMASSSRSGSSSSAQGEVELFSASQCRFGVSLMAINTMSHEIGTREAVRDVRGRYREMKAVMAPIFESIGRIGDAMASALKDSALSREALSRRMERLFFVNQSLLLSIGVGHSAISAVHRVCEECGSGEGFKITGAGRGG